MSKVVDLDLSKNPILQKGDIVQFWDGVEKFDGVIMNVTRRYTMGDVKGQAMAVNIAVASEDAECETWDSGQWSIHRDVPFTDIICRRYNTLYDFDEDEKAGTVLPFQCKT